MVKQVSRGSSRLDKRDGRPLTIKIDLARCLYDWYVCLFESKMVNQRMCADDRCQYQISSLNPS